VSSAFCVAFSHLSQNRRAISKQLVVFDMLLRNDP
jgi:hypothetical protein